MKKITYDVSTDSAYIYFHEPSIHRIVSKTYTCESSEVGWMINIDFDEIGKISWIELIPASMYLSEDLLKKLW